MAKLNKMEIGAISQQIQSDLRKEHKNSNDAKNLELSEAFYATETGQKVKFLADSAETAKFINDYSLKKFIGIAQVGQVSLEAIKRRLIIEQIECADIKELIIRVTESFKTE